MGFFDKDKAAFVDARSQHEYNLNHVPNVINFPRNFHFDLKSIDGCTGHQNFQKFWRDPDMHLIIYADMGLEISRCASVVAILRHTVGTEHAHRIVRLMGGLNAWKEAGLPCETH